MNPELSRSMEKVGHTESTAVEVPAEQLADFLTAVFREAVEANPNLGADERVRHEKTGIEFEVARIPKLSSKKHRGVRYLSEAKVNDQIVYTIRSSQLGWKITAFMPIVKKEASDGVA